jgi:uncharacterized Fe-S cluster-containing MiaB family protein
VRASRFVVRLYVSNFATSKLSPEKFRSPFGKQLKVLARLKIACQAFFVKIFYRAGSFLEMAEAFRL